MPAPLTCDSFIELCRKSGVVESEVLDAFLNKHQMPDDPRKVAAVLIQGGILTRFQAAQLLHGKYRGFVLNGLKILEQLGVGGMGAVYLCEQVMLRRKVAVKVLPTKQAQDRVARERFFREARAVAALDHPNIIRIHDCVSSNDIHYLLMEYVEGTDLQVKIEREGPLGVEDAIGFVIQAASGLMHAHERGLVHRDVKPSNLLLDPHGTVKLLDMGLARFFQDAKDNLTQQLDGGAVVGTVDFLSPEQAIESSNVDARADIYSLGATLYTLLSGKPPFGGTTTQKLINHQVKTPPPLNELRPDVPVELNAIVQKMMAKLPDDRYQSAQEVIEVLAAWAPAPTMRSSSTTVQAPRSSILPRSMSDASLRTAKTSQIDPPSTTVLTTVPPVKKVIRKELLIGGGIAAAAIIGVIVIMSFGGDKGDGEPVAPSWQPKQNQVNLEGTKKEVVAKKNEPKKAPQPVVKKGEPIPKDGRVLASLDWNHFAPLSNRYRGYDRIETRGSGKFPTDWNSSAWDKTSVIETSLEKVDNHPAIVQRNIEGKACNMLLTPEMVFSPNARYELHFEYRTRGEGKGSLTLWDSLNKNRTVADLPSTKDSWKTQHFSFDGFPAEVTAKFEFHLATIGSDAWIAYRQIQIREVSLPAPVVETPVYRIDFADSPAFSVRYQQTKLVSSTGASRAPEGWAASCWKAGSEGEAALETVGTTSMLALRTLGGDPTLQLMSSRPFENLQAGKAYKVRFTYLADARCYGEFQLRMKVPEMVTAHFPGMPLRSTHGLIRSVELEFTPLPNETYLLCIQNLSKGEKNTLFVKSVEVFEATPVVGSSVAKLDASTLEPFKLTLKEQEEIYRNGSGNLPPGWKAMTAKPKAVGTVGVEKIGDRKAVSLEMVEGDPSLQVQSSKPLGTLRAGRTYVLKAVYSTTQNRRGAVSVCNEANGPIQKMFLLPTNGEWREGCLRFEARSDQPFNLMLSNTGKQEEGRVFFESVELVEVTK